MEEGDENYAELIARFENEVRSNAIGFYDAEEYEAIVEHYFESNNIDFAQIAVECALAHYPYMATFKIYKAQYLAATHKTREALAILNELEIQDPENGDIFKVRGNIYSQMGLNEQAIENYKLALPYWENKDDIYIELGIEFSSQQKYDDALYYLKKAIKFNPDNEIALSEIMLVFEKAGFISDGINYFMQYLDEKPYNAYAWFNVGVFYSLSEEFEKAIQAYDYAILIQEDFASAYNNKANALMNLERYDEAIENFLETLKNEEPEASVYSLIGQCYEEKGDFDQALVNYNRAIKIDPKYANAWLNIGIILDLQNRVTEAVHYIKRAIDIDPAEPEFWYVFAEVQEKLGFLEEAGNAYAKVIELGYDDFDIWLDYSGLLAYAECTEMAIALLREGLRRFPMVAELHYRLSAVLLDANQKQEALIFLQNALTIDFDKVNELFEYSPELQKNEAVMQVINTYRSEQ